MLDYLVEHWWVLTVRGAAAIVFGLVAVLWPGITAIALATVFGVYALVDGVFAGWAALRAKEGDRPPLVWEAILGVVVGLVILAWPLATVLVLAILLGLWAIITGVFEILTAYRLRREIHGEWLYIFSGALSVAFGLVIWIVPFGGAVAMSFAIGAYAIVFGAALIGLSLRMRRMGLDDSGGTLRSGPAQEGPQTGGAA
ncbi:HdeD family acid-resistance protein [Streptomonospora wellingtoniae]|uniref:HdeD family acid-resistance protein n=1 Tax=Streptomonospora wellingtoniae TaxID=3075544 RepID=A0ABU2KNF7_9ACTN|nr:HdeD family acid-resistance protein [Streptomonospora sp. DSM 45055]MDT0300792.1 HdeD family acid-resistance protein [Streptomonospora sp. DSM 45055]